MSGGKNCSFENNKSIFNIVVVIFLIRKKAVIKASTHKNNFALKIKVMSVSTICLCFPLATPFCSGIYGQGTSGGAMIFVKGVYTLVQVKE